VDIDGGPTWTWVGYFDDQREAAEAHDAAARLANGAAARLNFPREGERSAVRTSAHRGVSWHAQGRWRAQLALDGRNLHLGCHDDEEDGARRVDRETRWRRLEYPHRGESGRKKLRCETP
jgi:hypothetical protein